MERFTTHNNAYLATETIASYDYIFISNIGFTLDAQIEIVKQLLDKGAKKIGITIGGSEDGITKNYEALIDETGRIANMSQEEKVVPSLEYNDIPLLPHTTVEIQRVTVRIVAHDVYFSDNTVPMYAEILSEDNK